MDRDLVEKVKNGTDIVAVISEYVSLKQKGRSYWGQCPFHEEKTPSFHVDPARQMYKCFGCGAGGDVISFLMEVKGLSFMETVEELAERLGIVVENRRTSGRRPSENKIYYAANSTAMEFFQKVLVSSRGKAALEYLEARSVSRETIDNFEIGYAPDTWDFLVRALTKRSVPLAAASKCGLIAERKTNGYYDRFRGRVMFPIRDINGEVIAFGGRVMGEGEPKYLNSPESPVFEKRKVLYNLNRARDFARKKGIVVVEGYMDVVSLSEAGVENTVATLGTSLSEEHVRLMRRFTRDITLVYDGDNAGKKAMLRAVEPFMNADIIPKVVILPAGKDPDDIARGNIEEWYSLMSTSKNIWEFIFDESFSTRDPSNIEDQKSIIEELAPVISGLKDRITVDLLVERLAARLGVREKTILSCVDVKKEAPSQSVVDKVQDRDMLEDMLARLMLFDEEAIRLVGELDLAKEFKQEDLIPLVSYLVSNGNSVLEDSTCPDQIRKTASTILSDGEFEGDVRKALEDASTQFLRRVIDRDIKKIQYEISSAQKNKDAQRLNCLLKEKNARLMEKKNIHNTVMEVLQRR